MKARPIRRMYLLAITLISIVAVIAGLKYILPLCLPFVFGYFLAWVAAPIVLALTKRLQMARGIASVLVVSTFLILLLTLTFFVFRAVISQLQVLLMNLPEYQAMLLRSVERICPKLDRLLSLSNGTVYEMVSIRFADMMGRVQTKGMGFVQENGLGIAKGFVDIVWNLIIVFISALLFVKDFYGYKEDFKRSPFYKEVHIVTKVLSDMGIAYLKAQLILLCITAVICTIGLFFTRNHYAILIGIGIGIFDAFPVLGSAFILIPWAMILFIKRKMSHALIIIITYIICQITRQILEPKLVGDRIGVRPVYTLASMYAGLKIYGGFGFFLGPITLIAIKAIVNAAIGHFKGETAKEETKG